MAFGCLWLCGCGGTKSGGGELSDAEYHEAIQLIREGNEEKALPLFLRVVARDPCATSSHLYAGRIYLTGRSDPVYAIYHFREYLSRTKNAKEAAVVRQLVDTAKKNFIRSLPGQGSEFGTRAELMAIAARLREENIALKRALRAAQERCQSLESSLADGAKIAAVRTDPPPEKRVKHIVRAGDTLSKISQQYYGSPVHWKKIFEANQSEIPFQSALTVGQELIIP
ncbi:MAG: LysM peptidoglycan-binding domain-containing protein [Puniceicoccales bacterium]|nr:LysM peptidoglycan-binding domain-containing protein [Puniceicoccales bacterium]